MTLTKVVLPEYCSPTSVSSISSFQKSERNQSSRREMSASMAAAGSERGRARTTTDTASHERVSARNPPTALQRAPRRDSGRHRQEAATAGARKPSGSYDSPYPPPTPSPAQPRKHTARTARAHRLRAPAGDIATWWCVPRHSVIALVSIHFLSHVFSLSLWVHSPFFFSNLLGSSQSQAKDFSTREV